MSQLHGTSGLGECASMQPSTEECPFDVLSGSDLSFKLTSASDAAKSANKNTFEQNVFVLVLSSDLLEIVHFNVTELSSVL